MVRELGFWGEAIDKAMINGTAIHNHWYLVSSHGAVLFYVAVNPGCTIKQIAEDMSLTQRTVWGLIGDLRRADQGPRADDAAQYPAGACADNDDIVIIF